MKKEHSIVYIGTYFSHVTKKNIAVWNDEKFSDMEDLSGSNIYIGSVLWSVDSSYSITYHIVS